MELSVYCSRIPHISPSSLSLPLPWYPSGSRNYTTFTYGTAVGFTGGLVLMAYASPPDCAAANPAKLLQVGPYSGPYLAPI